MRADGYAGPWVSLARGLAYGEAYRGALFEDASPRIETQHAGITVARHPRGKGATPRNAVFVDGSASWVD